MLRLLIAALIMNCATCAAAGHAGGDGFGGRGIGFGFGFGHHGDSEIGDLGFGLGLNATDRIQDRLENRFDDLTTDYETGVVEIDDFFNSEEYTDIVDGTELLVDRYGFFVGGVERRIERLDDIISIANDDLTYYSDLLAEYQADEDLSAERLERLENWINRSTDRLETRIDRLTDFQTTLEENLPTYVSFQTDISTFLDDIIIAGEADTTTLTSALTSSAVTSAALSSNAVMASSFTETAEACSALSRSAATAVPEPASVVAALLALALTGVVPPRRKR